MKLLPVFCILVFLVAFTSRTEASQIPMRLCGREFLRAVVYTCGGSRWRRNRNEVVINESEQEDTELLDLCCRTGCRRSDLALMC